jgi:hypothetical protein
LIQETAASLSVAVISEERAERHLRDLISELMGDAIRLDEQMRQRIHVEGLHWGLSESHVNELVRKQSLANYQRRKSERQASSLALAAASIAVLFVIGFLSWTMLESQVAPTKPLVDPGPAPPLLPPPPTSESDDAWWDADLAVAIANARIEFPMLRSPLMDLDATSPGKRWSAYQKLIQHLLDGTANELERHVLLQVVGRCCALEPDEANANQIARALLAVVPAPGASLAEDPQAYSKMFWATRTAVAALLSAPPGGSRAGQLAQELAAAIGAPVDPHQAPRMIQRQCMGAFAENVYRMLISAAATQPYAVSPIHPVVYAEAVRYLDAALIDKLNADFLVALLSAASDLWQQYGDLLRRTIESPDPLAVVKLVDLYENTTRKALQEFMSGPLLRRAGAFSTSESVSEIANEVRRSLGVQEELTADNRWTWLNLSANRVLAELAPATESGNQVPEDVTTLAHYATLGCALAQGDTGAAEFDKLREAGTPDLFGDESFARDRRDAPSAASYDMIENSINVIARPSLGWATRIGRLQRLARMAEGVRDVRPHQAEILARYLLAAKSDDEHERMLREVPPLADWKHLRLALADGLNKAKLTRQQLSELLEAILGRRIKFGEDEAGREAVRAELLRDVVADMNLASEDSVQAYQSYDALRGMLLRLYKTQAQLMGVAPGEASWEGPADVLRSMIEAAAARLLTRDLGEDVRREVQETGHQLTALDYVASDDLQRTLLLERQWMRLLAMDVAQRFPRRAATVDEILQDMTRIDRQAPSIVTQMRDGQAILLRLWLLRNQPG